MWAKTEATGVLRTDFSNGATVKLIIALFSVKNARGVTSCDTVVYIYKQSKNDTFFKTKTWKLSRNVMQQIKLV